MKTKELVLEALSEAKKSQTAISGEELAKKCQVSRAAIWKAVDSLRKEGFIIQGTTNGGYILEENNDVVSPALFYSYIKNNYSEESDLHKDLHKIQVECFKEIDSTNLYAKKLLAASPRLDKRVIIAEHQTAGRGRMGRTFYSPDKTGIYLSAIYSPASPITNPAKITAFSAVAVCRAIKKLYGIETKIKWINDIFYNDKKICGILTEGFTNFETSLIESAIIGIGINIEENKEAFPEEVKKIAGAIFSGSTDTLNTHITRCELAAEVSVQLYKILEEAPEAVFEEYKRLSFLLGKTLTVYPVIGDEKSSYKAKAVDIDENASLIVELSDGSKKSLFSGEVSLKSANF
ncbi:MAG: biotin--[acetyl-CoA-carboxylase] ligase [Treponema sp.]|nr:biotin--[acetyl-CoA-carboxylase] ligase [Treponema sp.]